MATTQTNRKNRTALSTAKFDARRSELAKAALSTLSQLGYARGSLREIAQNSEFSHGVLHYYFNDKNDLIVCSIREFKTRCVARYEAVVDQATSVAQLIRGVSQALDASIREDGPIHRFWYDVRAQAMFDRVFLADVLEIDTLLRAAVGRVFDRLAELMGAKPRMSVRVAYALFDGLFQQCLLQHTAGSATAIAEMQGAIVEVVTGLMRDGQR